MTQKRFGVLRFVSWQVESLGWIALVPGAVAFGAALVKLLGAGGGLGSLAASATAAVPMLVGLVLVLIGQCARCFVEIEHNTRGAEEAAERLNQAINTLGFQIQGAPGRNEQGAGVGS